MISILKPVPSLAVQPKSSDSREQFAERSATDTRMVLRVRPATIGERKQAFVEDWYRDQLKRAIPALIAKWEPLIGVTVARFYARRMKTKWGSCHPEAKSIRLNTDLAKSRSNAWNTSSVHEMIHLLEPTHNPRFLTLIDQFLPQWQFCRAALNRLPVRHENWIY
jgi:predicted metal-dependent hydrolase